VIPDNTTFAVLDTETTSADPDRGVVEVGWVFVDENLEVLSEHESLIDPQMMISPSASGVHGLTNADVASSPTLKEFFSEDDPSCFGRKLPGPLVMIGHRISFDSHTIRPYVDGEVLELCTLRWARRIYPDADDHKLSTLAFALGLPRPTNAHRVMGDVYTALYLARHICERTGHTLRSLAAASQEPFELAKFPFGKHKGVDFRSVPKSYLRWARENMKDLDQDMLHTIKICLG